MDIVIILLESPQSVYFIHSNRFTYLKKNRPNVNVLIVSSAKLSRGWAIIPALALLLIGLGGNVPIAYFLLNIKNEEKST